jgi:hypothetical protein
MNRFYSCSVLGAALAASACGARTELDAPNPAPRDGGEVADAGRDDGGGRRDAGRRDAGPPRRDAGGFDAGSSGMCRRDADCAAAESCVADRSSFDHDLDPVELVCAPRVRDDDGSECDDADSCSRGLCIIANRCIRPCVADADCEDGQVCLEVFARTGRTSLQPYGGCVARHDALPDVTVSAEATRTLEAGLNDVRLDGNSDPTVWVIEPQRGLAGVVSLSTVGPPVDVLFDLEALLMPGAPAPLNPAQPAWISSTILLPNGPRAILSDRGYDVVFESELRTSARVLSFARARAGAILDLDVYYVGGGRLSPGADEMTAAIARVGEIYRPRGITIGEVREHEIVGGLRSRLGTIAFTSGEDADELVALHRLSAGAGRSSVNVFVVRDLGTAAGVAGGVPGPPAMHGVAGSGIAIAADLLLEPGFPLDMGGVMAHEIGHQLGLFHTSEADGSVIDPLPDTPECRIDRDTNGDGLLAPDECASAGSTNLMFWAGEGTILSRAQGNVMRSVPVLR